MVEEETSTRKEGGAGQEQEDTIWEEITCLHYRTFDGQKYALSACSAGGTGSHSVRRWGAAHGAGDWNAVCFETG